MLTYYISGSNGYTIRTQPTASNEFTLSLQDMYGLNNFTASLISTSFEGYESYIQFTASISGAIVGSEYRATLLNSGSNEALWHGSIQVFASQSVDKTEYKTQNDGYISYTGSSNEYIILT
jgi:hypothetical protein